MNLIVAPETCRLIAASPLNVTPEGATVGKDLLELKRVGGTLKVTGMAVSVAPAGGGAAGGGRSAGTRPNGDIPLSVRVGPRPTQRSGALDAGGSDTYLIRAGAQQLVEIRIDGVRARDIVARLLVADTDTAVDARADQGVRTWTGRVGAGEYRIQIVRLAPGADTLTYTLSVTLR